MKIIFLTRRFYPDIGGVEKHVLEVSRLLVKDGHKVLVVTESQGDEKEIDGIEIKRIKTPGNWFKKFYIWAWLFKRRNYIKGADVVHAHDVYYWYLPFRFIYPRKPSYITFHGYENYPVKFRAKIVRRVSGLLSSGSVNVGNYIEKWYGTKSKYVMYGGTLVPNKLDKPKNTSSVVFVGRLESNTGILEYAKAVDLIKKKIPDFKFTIVGDGELKYRLNQYDLVGFKQNAGKYISEANFVFASGYLSILEAMSNKRLVLAIYDNPLRKDYLSMTLFKNLMIVENNPENLAKSISSLIKNPKKKKKMENDAFEYAKNQTWVQVKDIYLKLWV